MSMGRKEYRALAQALYESKPPDGTSTRDQETYDIWLKGCYVIAAVLRSKSGLDNNGNRRFDTGRFMQWCIAGKDK